MSLPITALLLLLASQFAFAAPPTLVQQGGAVASSAPEVRPPIAVGEVAPTPAAVTKPPVKPVVGASVKPAALPAVKPATPAPAVSGPPKPGAVPPTPGAVVQKTGAVPPKPVVSGPPKPGVMPVKTASAPVAPAAKTGERKAPQWMPGLANGIPGDPDSAKPNVVLVSLDRAEIIQISADFANRIATPFRAPKATGIVDSEAVIIDQAGQSLYVQVKNNMPVALFITDAAQANAPVMSVTLVPRPNLPPQTIVLQTQGVALGEEKPKASEMADTYTGMLRDWLRDAAAGRTPRGFSESSLKGAVGVVGALVVRPLRRYAGSRYDIFHYIIEAGTTVADGAEVEIDEDSFNSEGVRAVAIFPRQRLTRGDMTNVFVVSDKPDDDRLAATVRMEAR